MARAAGKAAHITTGNIFGDLGFSPETTLALTFKAKIFSAVLGEVHRKKYTQKQLTNLLDEHQPVISNLLRGRISQMSIEKLLIYAGRLGVALDVRPVRAPARRGRVA